MLEAVCWDKDRFGKDYMGEFDLLVEDIFAKGQLAPEPRWYTLKGKQGDTKKKGNEVSGEIQVQFNLVAGANPSASEADILSKFRAFASSSPSEGATEESSLSQVTSLDGADDDDDDADIDGSDEADDPTKPETAEKRKRRLKIKAIKRKRKAQAYELSGGSDTMGMVFMEVTKITDLPPERNMTRTTFDMDPFVVVSLGRKTFRTRVVRHSLNPVFEEKMVFQVMRHEQQYSLNFAVVDRDKLSGNDFVGTLNFPLSTLIQDAPEPDPDTGLFPFVEPPEPTLSTPSTKSRFRLPLSRSASGTSLNKQARPPMTSRTSQSGLTTSSTNGSSLEVPPVPLTPSTPATSVPSEPAAVTAPTPAPPTPGVSRTNTNGSELDEETVENGPMWEDPDLKKYVIPLVLKNKDKWGDRTQTLLYVKAKYLPYPALRQQFWRAMLKQYDADESGRISKIELTTMLDTLGSTLKESTIDGFFDRWHAENSANDLCDMSFDQAVICLEEQLVKAQQKSVGSTVKGFLQSPETIKNLVHGKSLGAMIGGEASKDGKTNETAQTPGLPPQAPEGAKTPGAERADPLARDDLTDDSGEEHVIEIRECPICHQPRLNKRSDADIITHIATCASSDWRQVNNIVMAGFVTSSQAQRKWYSKVINKVGYGGYKLGANSANILVQDRLTGQINEEKMSVYVRLGIRLLYKGLKSRDMETKRSKWSWTYSDARRLTEYSSQPLEVPERQARQKV